MTRLIDLPTLAQLVHDITPARFMTELAEHLRSAYLRWPDFDKPARVPSHSAGGVIELMPVADSAFYSFKYVNGHPEPCPTRCEPERFACFQAEMSPQT